MENLSRQIEEIEVLLSIYSSEFSLQNESDFALIQEMLENEKIREPLPQIRVQFELDNNMYINVIFPSQYPKETCTYEFHSPHHSNRNKSNFEKHIIAQHQELIGESCMMEILEWIRENIPSVEKEASKSVDTAEKARKARIKRSYMWTHHIYSKRKKRTIKSFVDKFGLKGFTVTGKPGIIVLEGDEQNVSTVVSELKRLTWQQFLVRFSEFDQKEKFSKYDYVDYPGQKSDLSQVRRLLDAVDLGHHYAELVGVDSFSSPQSTSKAQTSHAPFPYISSKKDNTKDCIISCSVKPNARSTEIVSIDGSALELRLAAPPKNGAANKELCKFLSKVLGVASTQVSCIAGGKSRNKIVLICGLTSSKASSKLRST